MVTVTVDALVLMCRHVGACLRKEPRMVLTAINMATMYIFYSYIRIVSDA